MPHDVFISYSSQDAVKANEVVRALEKAGVRCWIAERDILPGTANWAADVERAISEARAMVLLVSPDFNRSVQTPKEMILAIAEKLFILPIRITDFQPWEHLRYFLADCQWVDASGEKLAQRLDLVSTVLRNYLARGPAAVAFERLSQPKSDGLQPAQALGILPLGASLKLDMWRPMKLRNDQPSLWLQAYNALVPMTGREPEIEELFQMIWAEGLFRWRIFFGEAGIGKTRLAIEFARKAQSDGWYAGFLSGSNLQSFVSAGSFKAWRPCLPTLVVVDYAASKVADLRRFFEHLSAMEAENDSDMDAAEATPPVRVLLLERHADEARGWLHELLSAGESVTGDLLRSTCYLGLKKLQPPGGLATSGTVSSDFTRQIILNTFERWATITGRHAPPLPDFTEKDWRNIQLRTGNRPLYLQMAAIHACERGSAVQLPAWGRGELLRAAVAREREYVKAECAGNADLCKAVEHITAILCLAGGGAARGRQWIQAVGEELRGIGVFISPNKVEENRRAIFAEPQKNSSDVETGVIQPDIVSEGFAAQVLQGEEGGPPYESLKQVLRLAGVKAWANLVRMVQDLVGIEKQLFPCGEIGSIDSWLPPLLADRSTEELHQLTNIIPERSISLHEFAVIVNEHLLKCVPADHVAERAECLLLLGIHRIRSSRTTREALEQAIRELQEAITLFGQLPLADGQRGCRLKMAKAYRLIDTAFTSLMKYQDAAINSAIAARLASGETGDCRVQDMATEIDVAALRTPDGQQSMSEFADCLNNLGMNLNSLQRCSEALATMQRAVEVGEKLIAYNWHQYAPDLARYLNNLSQAQVSCNDLEGAVLSSRRSAQIRSEFARENPDEFAQPLSFTLENLVKHEYSLKNVAGAQAATEQLIAVYDDLSARDPASYRAPLAQCYHNIGYLVDSTGNKAEGIRYTLEAVKIREELLESDFDRHALGLAWSHNNVGNMYHELSDFAKAHTHLERSYALRLKWVENAPGRQLPELINSANLMAKLCRDENDEQAEVTWLERTVRHGRSAELPLADRAMAAHSLAEALGRLGRTSEAAAAAASAAEDFLKEFNSRSPEDNLSMWANAGCNLASALTLQGDWTNDPEVLARGMEVSQQVLSRINPEEGDLSFVWGALMNNLGHAQYRQSELLGQIEGLRKGIESLKAGAHHQRKHGYNAAAEETTQLIVRAQDAAVRMQGMSNSGAASS